MYTTALTSLHEKAIKTLEAIDRSKEQQSRHEESLTRDLAFWETRNHHSNRIVAHERIQKKLWESYNALLKRINNVAVKQ